MKTLRADSVRPASRLSSDHVPIHFGRYSSSSDRFMPESADGRAVAVCWAVASFLPTFRSNVLLAYRAVGHCATSGKVCQIWCTVSEDIVFPLLALNNDVKSFLGFTYVYM